MPNYRTSTCSSPPNSAAASAKKKKKERRREKRNRANSSTDGHSPSSSLTPTNLNGSRLLENAGSDDLTTQAVDGNPPALHTEESTPERVPTVPESSLYRCGLD